MPKNFFLNFINNLFALQERFLEGKHKKKLNVLNYSNGTMSKAGMVHGASLNLTYELEKTKKQVEEFVRKLAVENYGHFENLLEYAKERNTKTYLLKNGDKFLKMIGETTGLILPKKGFRALYLNLLTRRNFSFQTDAMFIFKKETISPYEILCNFYKWYAYTLNLPGFNDKDFMKVKNLKDFGGGEIEKLGYKEIINLKEAINRDKDAMNFTVKFMKENEGSKKAFDIMKKNDSGANI